MDKKLNEIYERYRNGRAITLQDVSYLYEIDEESADILVNNIIAGHAPTDHTEESSKKVNQHLQGKLVDLRQAIVRPDLTKQNEYAAEHANMDINKLISSIVAEVRKGGESMKENLFRSSQSKSKIVQEVEALEQADQTMEKRFSLYHNQNSTFNTEA